MKKKGFTLIELMIVLAVIAILAVVLIPKAGQSKDNAKNAGVTTNVNAVRGYLETKTGDNFLKANASDVVTKLNVVFTGEDAIENPFDTTKATATTTASTSTYGPAIYVTAADLADADLSNYEGSVVVVYNSTAKTYSIYGVDNSKSKVGAATIK